MELLDWSDPLVFNGLLFPRGAGYTEEKLAVLPRLPARKDDIFIVSFARSGSTWTQEIVWQILHNGKIDERRLDVRVPYVEGIIQTVKAYPYTVNDAESIEKTFSSFPEPRVFKTHLSYHMVPKGRDEATKPQYIYVMRNPKDVFVSMYHHRYNMPYCKEISTWDEAFESFMAGKGNSKLHFATNYQIKDKTRMAHFFGKVTNSVHEAPRKMAYMQQS